MAKKTPLLILSLIVPLVILTPLLQVLVATSPVKAGDRNDPVVTSLYENTWSCFAELIAFSLDVFTSPFQVIIGLHGIRVFEKVRF